MKARKKCNKVMPLLVEFVDEELDGGKAEMVRDHLLECPDCKKVCEDIKGGKMLVSSLPELHAPADFLVSVRRRISAQAEKSGRALHPARRNFLPFLFKPPVPQLSLALGFIFVFISAFTLGRYLYPVKDMPGQGVVAHSDRAPMEDAIFSGVTPRDTGGEFSVEPARVADAPAITGFHGSAHILPVSTGSSGMQSPLIFPYDTPSEFVQAIIKNDPRFKNADIYPLPQGALVHTPLKLYEIKISNTAFMRARKLMLIHGASLPDSLTRAQTIYNLKISALPSPLLPLNE